MARLLLVLVGGLARYPQDGGHWACFLQYVLGLRDFGHDVFWLGVLSSTDVHPRDERSFHIFFTRFVAVIPPRRARHRRPFAVRRGGLAGAPLPRGLPKADLQ
jgi:hypothetical protein